LVILKKVYPTLTYKLAPLKIAFWNPRLGTTVLDWLIRLSPWTAL